MCNTLNELNHRPPLASLLWSRPAQPSPFFSDLVLNLEDNMCSQSCPSKHTISSLHWCGFLSAQQPRWAKKKQPTRIKSKGLER